MKHAQASGRFHRTLWRDLAVVLAVVAAAGLVAASTPFFGWLFGRLSAVAVATWLGVALSALLAVAFVYVRRVRPTRPATRAPGPGSFPELNPNPVLDLSADAEVLYRNPAAAVLFPSLGEEGTAHPFLRGLPRVLDGLRHGKRRHIVREVRVGGSIYEQHVLRLPGTEGVHVYGVDITPQKHAAEARLQSEEKFTRVFRSAPMAISISRLADGRFLDANDSFVRLLGYVHRSAIVGRTASDIDLWVEGGQRARMLELLSDEDEAAVRSLEAQVRRQDGTTRDVLLSLELMEFDGETCVLSTMLDVTERKQAEAGIAVLKSFYESTLSELPIQVAVLDDQARFFYLNPEAVRDDDLRAQMVGKNSVDYARLRGFPLAPYERRHQWLLDVIARKEIGQLEETLTTPNGETRHLLRVATPVLDEDDVVVYVVGYGLDITDQKETERQLVEAKNAAEEMARLKSAFVANMSHEIRTPLTAILGFATVLGEELSGEQRELIEIIKQSGERLLETLNSVLDLARLEANALEVDPKPLDLEEEILAAARLYEPLAHKNGLGFEIDVPRRPLFARLDRPCLHRILSNLLSNAIKFTDSGTVRLVLRPGADEVQIVVADSGIGIDESFLPDLFEEFKQESTGLARTHTGSGLGLAITRHLVERMHGRIEVESRKDVGTTFTVTFPRIPDTSENALHEPTRIYGSIVS